MSARTFIPRVVLVLGALLALAACHGRLAQNVGVQQTAPGYEAFHPYYAELCAASQFRKRPDTGIEIEGGGFGGHAVIYLNGVCRVKDANYPVLKLCDPGFDPRDDGVGISVNDHYLNANWVATQGRQFFFHGLPKEDEGLSPKIYDATVADAKRRGILDGIVFRDVYLKARPAQLDEETYKYQISFGTDYALNDARDRYCARVPLTQDQMADAVRYLNDVNAPYREGRKTFKWSVIKNNCSHLYHNVLSAAGVWPFWPVNRPLLVSAFSFPTPKNEFVNLARWTNHQRIGDVEAVWRDRYLRQSLLKYHRLPVAPGALIALERIAQPNAIYDPDIQLVFYDDPTVGPYVRRYKRIIADPRYSDLRANLTYFDALYRTIEANRKPLSWHLRRPRAAGTGKGAGKGEGFADFYVQYYNYIARQRVEVTRDLERLGAGHAMGE